VRQSDNLRGIVLMIAAMAGFAVEDMFIKFAAADLPAGFILAAIGIVGGLFFAALARMQGQRSLTRGALHPAVMGRNAGEVLGTFGFVTALTLAPLSTVSAVSQAMPLFVTMGAALFLGEAVGWRRWTAICVGFAGVILIVRPGMEGFDPNVLWAVLAVVGLGGRDLFTRRIPTEITTTQLSVWGFWAVGLLGLAMLWQSGGSHWPTPAQAGYILGALTVGIGAYWALTKANRLGEMSVITPFRYSRLIFALAIGILVFGERPDALTLLGGTLIIASGLYTFARERARKRAAAASA
jgi:drug/metabolite transporter (DMT)-like permease